MNWTSKNQKIVEILRMSKFLLHLKRMSNQRQPNEIVYYTPLPSTPSLTRLPLIVELKNEKYQFGIENMELKIPNLRYIAI